MRATSPPPGFREIEHTADRAIEVWAGDLAGLFEQAARGMFALMVDLDTLAPVRRHDIVLEYDDPEGALVDWLNELLFWHETQGELYGQFGVSLESGEMKAWFAGEPAEPTGAHVKAATYHDLRLEQDMTGMWRTTIVFDT